MARIRYTGSNGEEPPLTELEREKLRGQQIANEIAQTKLRRLHEEILERREVKWVYETTMIILRQEMMRWPSLAVRAPELLHLLSHEQLHAVRMSFDQFIRAELVKARGTLEKALRSPREVIAEFVGAEEPSQKEVDAMERKKARANARRRVSRSKATQ
jgi:hypothetical protein